jgi:hypothetical protein
MIHQLEDKPVVTLLVCALALIVVIAGAVVTIIRPGSLPFHDYVLDVTIVLAALGLGAGIGRGAIAAAKHETSGTDAGSTDEGEVG